MRAAGAIAPLARGYRDGHPWYVLTQWAVAGALRAVADVHAEGMELCPPRGTAALVVSNHLSYMDIPLVGAWTPRQIIYFSKMEVRRWPVVGWVSASYGTIYVRRGEADRQAIREALGCLAAQQLVGVFPEGHRSHGQGLLCAQPGVALLAQRSRALVWPVGVTGSEHIGHRVRPRVTLRGGPPFDPLAAARDACGPSPTHQDIADTIMRHVAALLPPSYRGVYR